MLPAEVSQLDAILAAADGGVLTIWITFIVESNSGFTQSVAGDPFPGRVGAFARRLRRSASGIRLQSFCRGFYPNLKRHSTRGLRRTTTLRSGAIRPVCNGSLVLVLRAKRISKTPYIFRPAIRRILGTVQNARVLTGLCVLSASFQAVVV